MAEPVVKLKRNRKSAYHALTEGEWFNVPRRGHQNACCHCALVHRINYRVNKRTGRIQVQYHIEARATAAMRRPFKFTRDVE